MVPSFIQGWFLRDEDLVALFFHAQKAYSPVYLRYEFGYNHPDFGYQRIGPENRIPTRVDVGKYRPNFIVDPLAPTGSYTLIWKYQVSEGSDMLTREVDFEVHTEGLYENTYRTLGYVNLIGSLDILVISHTDLSCDLAVLEEGSYDLVGDLAVDED